MIESITTCSERDAFKERLLPSISVLDDTEHVRAFIEGYPSGFQSTVRYLISRGANRDLAEELAQDAWVHGWERLYQLRDALLLVGWINMIALNMFWDWTKSRKWSEPFSFKREPAVAGLRDCAQQMQ